MTSKVGKCDIIVKVLWCKKRVNEVVNGLFCNNFKTHEHPIKTGIVGLYMWFYYECDVVMA